METQLTLGDLVAEREYRFADYAGGESLVTVRVGKPTEQGEGEWVCPYEIRGPIRTKLSRMIGVDSLQALLLTLQVLLPELDHIAQRDRGTFTLFDGPDLGLPDYRNSRQHSEKD